MDRQYDVIVIGAGNGGLSAAASACSRGLKTLLIEQHNLPGGFATSFRRGRFEFEPALHELCDVGEPDARAEVGALIDFYGAKVDWVQVPEAYRLIITGEGEEKIDAVNPNGRVLFATTNYHVFRSGLQARRVKMRALGIGAPTKWYFWPNAGVREFAGLLTAHRGKQTLILGGMILLYVLLTLLEFMHY